MMYKFDCVYIERQRLRPYCYKLDKEIRPKDCHDCGWYRMNATSIDRSDILQFGELTVEDVRRIMRKGLEEELG